MTSSESTLGQHTLIVTPTYNERENLPLFVQRTLDVVPAAHILVVDDGSPDGTGELADSMARVDARVRVLHRPQKLGLGTAYAQAFSENLQAGYRYFFEMDTDLSHDPKYLPDFYRAFDAGADVVVGSRNVAGGRAEGWGLGRHLVSKGGSLFSRLVLGLHVRDLTTGYKAYTLNALKAIDLGTLEASGYGFQVETTYRAVRCGLKVVEVPIVFVDRRLGQSKMSGSIFREALLLTLNLRFRRR
jgi:dolichol-phosphate mannosyltransferase